MLVELGVYGVVLGHSERRELFGETDRALALKVPAALDAGLVPILCVGETEQERDEGATERKLRHQIQEDLGGVPTERLAEVVIAYEPIWAIGTGRVASPEQAQEAIAFMRALIADRDADAGAEARILYGGSVKPENAAELLALRGRRRSARRRRLAGGALVRGDRPVGRRRGSGASPRDAPAGTGHAAGAARLPGGARRLGARPSPVPATRSRWRARPSSTSCGRSTRTRR